MTRASENLPSSSADAADPAMPELPTHLATPPADESLVEPAPPTAEAPAAEEKPLTAKDPLPADLLPPSRPSRSRIGMTRTSAMWLGVWAGVVVVILLIIFVAQNTSSVQIKFFGASGHISLALALLIAGVGGAIIAMGVSAARIIQLRRMVRRGR